MFSSASCCWRVLEELWIRIWTFLKGESYIAVSSLLLTKASALPILRQLGSKNMGGSLLRSVWEGDTSILKVWVGLEARKYLQNSADLVSVFPSVMTEVFWKFTLHRWKCASNMISCLLTFREARMYYYTLQVRTLRKSQQKISLDFHHEDRMHPWRP